MSESFFEEVNGIVLEILTPKRFESLIKCYTSVWVTQHKPTLALGITYEEYEPYARMRAEKSMKDKLGVVCVERSTGKVVAYLITEDFSTLHFTDEELRLINPKIKIYLQFSQLIEDKYREYLGREPEKGEIVHGIAGGVLPEYQSRGLLSKVEYWCNFLMLVQGYKRAFGVAVHPITYLNYKRRQDYKHVVEQEFASFEYEGQRPFASIKEPKGALLSEYTQFLDNQNLSISSHVLLHLQENGIFVHHSKL